MFNLPESANSVDSLFNCDFSETLTKNQRIATRYIRDDIAASVRRMGLFCFGGETSVQLMDITSKGVLIATSKKFRVNKKINLTLEFASGKIFKIKAAVVHKSDLSPYQYGIKFDRYNNELGDYLLETQSKLVFK
jgi:hypothetical protein